AEHPYLKEVSRFQQAVGDALDSLELTDLPAPQWDLFSEAFGRGIPMLAGMVPDEAVISQAGALLSCLAERLAGEDIPEELRLASGLLLEELRQSPDATGRIVSQLLSEEGETLPGTLRYLGWRALERALLPWVKSLEGWLEGKPIWGRPSCPLCGSGPAMAQLVRTNKGRERFLSCGCCRSRWSYQRTGCAFCGNQDQDTMQLFELEQDEPFRIDVCEDCKGYLKTYTDEGDEGLMLADWSSLHLDILALQEGYQRRVSSLYEL
ncbi:MAG: formate dehydrogenase accessory protein FdhE, partial [Nitrospirales bacterium]|nr:formate dehydrogenase accessory protein FdhE [Nitrospirales bacterium]